MKQIIIKIFNIIPLPLQFKMYLVIGGFAGLSYVLSANLSMMVFNNSLISGAIAFFISWMISYWGNLLFTFKVENKNHKVKLFKDIIRNIIVLLFLQSIIYCLYDILRINFQIVSFIAALSAPIVSYPLMKYWVFKD